MATNKHEIEVKSDAVDSAEQKIVVAQEEKPASIEPEPISPLQARLAKRHAIFSKHPRLIAGAWFAGCAFLATCVISQYGGSMLFGSGTFGIAAMAALSALIPALLIGDAIAKPNGVKSAWRAISLGAVIVFTAHILLPFVETAVIYIFSNTSNVVLSPSFIGMTWAFGIMIGGVATFPLGMFAAFLLYKLRGITLGPQGCTVHGYGMIEDNVDQ